MTLDAERKYVNSIRNRAKRAYAERYLRYMRDDAQGIPFHEPAHPGLSVMGAQAVRMNLSKKR